jgi:hypothetical protein
LKFERRQQGDPNVIPLVQITFREVVEEELSDDDGTETVWEWTAPK